MTRDLVHAIFAADVYGPAGVTPLHPMKDLSQRLGRTVHQKREDRQPGGSFKIRGATNKIRTLTAEALAGGVLCASAGNHAQGVAMACAQRGVEATVFMPVTTPRVKVEAVRRLGARVVLEGEHFDDACAAALLRQTRCGGAFIHPFDDLKVIAGQGVIGLELASQHPDPIDAVFLPVGGGGLASGVAAALRVLRPGVKLIGVEAEDAPTLRASLDAGRIVSLKRLGRFADGAAVRRIGDLTFDLCRRLLDEVILVSPDQIRQAVRETRRELKVVPEPAGALALAGLCAWAQTNPGCGALIAVLSGANVDPEIARALLAEPFLSPS